MEGHVLETAPLILGSASPRRAKILQRLGVAFEVVVPDVDEPHDCDAPVETVTAWTSQQFVDALRHDASCLSYNSDFRQLLHVAFKVAGEMGGRYTAALARHEAIIARNVESNLYERHLKRLFG